MVFTRGERPCGRSVTPGGGVDIVAEGRPVVIGTHERLVFVDAPGHVADLAW